MVKRQTITSQVIEHVLGLIKVGKLNAGDKLPTQKELTESLGVSRTCVREAMKSLESLGVVEIRAKIGTVVGDQSRGALFGAENLIDIVRSEQVDALIDMRIILEVGLAALAGERAQLSDLVAMRTAIESHKHALESDRIAHYADLDFHLAVARAAKNPIALKMLEMIVEPLTKQRMLTNSIPGAAEDGLRDHYKILKAIDERKPEKARLAMLAHMQTAARYLRIALASASTKPLAAPLAANGPSDLPQKNSTREDVSSLVI